MALVYEDVGDQKEQLTGVIVIETDDLLGGGVGDQFHNAATELRRRFNLGKWVELNETA